MMSNSKQNNIMINYLLKVTDYSKKYILSKSDEQLYAFYKKIKICMEKYPREIINLQNKIEFCPEKYTLEELLKFNYNQLLEIRNYLEKALKWRLKQSQEATAEEADFEQLDEQEEFLTPEELYVIYGPEIADVNEQELQKNGYRMIDCEDMNAIIKRNEENLKNAIIELLVTFDNETYKETFLKKLNMRELISIYKRECQSVTSLPSYNVLKLSYHIKDDGVI